MDFFARTDLTYKRNTYSMQSEYKVQSSSISSSGSLVIPQRTMNYEMSASNQNGRMTASTEFKWDAANDANKKVSKYLISVIVWSYLVFEQGHATHIDYNSVND